MAGQCCLNVASMESQHDTAGISSGAAMNYPQYNGSMPCGMCLGFRGTGKGVGLTPLQTSYDRYVIGQSIHAWSGQTSTEQAIAA